MKILSQNDMKNRTPIFIRVHGLPHSFHAARPSHNYLDFRPCKPSPIANDPKTGGVLSQP